MPREARDETPRLLTTLKFLEFLLQALREPRVRGRRRVEELKDDL